MLQQPDFWLAVKEQNQAVQNSINKTQVEHRFPKNEKRGRYSGISRSENRFNDYR